MQGLLELGPGVLLLNILSVSEDQAEINRRTVAGVIMRLFEGTGEQQGEGAKQLALMMVEIISPDIMYNVLPCPVPREVVHECDN